MTQIQNVPTETINMRLTISMLEALKAEAAKRGIPFKTLILLLLQEKLDGK